MATPADLVRDVCGQLARYLPALEPLIAEPDSQPAYADRMKGRVSAAPLPGNAPALLASAGIHGLARWWESVLLYDLGADDAWNRRGGSDANTLLALRAIVKLAAGASDEALGLLMADLRRIEADASALPAIDEAHRWRPIPPRRDANGNLIPACPYCKGYFLKAELDSRGHLSGRVECRSAWSTPCRDYAGQRPVAQLGTDEHGRPVLAWPDFTETAPDLEA